MITKIAIMQPYIFPYIGYFSLIHAVDTFVFLNDVQYIRRGYMNRNSILSCHGAQTFTIPVNKASRDTEINKILIHQDNYTIWKLKFFKSLKNSYSNAPFYDTTISLLHKVFDKNFIYLETLTNTSIREVCGYLGIDTNFMYSDQLSYTRKGKGQEKILSICNLLKAHTYINAPNGKGLYDKEEFSKDKISLQFIKPEISSYPQNTDNFISHLSIIDHLMFMDKKSINKHIRQYNFK